MTLVQDNIVYNHKPVMGYEDAAQANDWVYISNLIEKKQRRGIACTLPTAAKNNNIELSYLFIEKMKTMCKDESMCQGEFIPGIEEGLYYASLNNNKELVNLFIKNGAKYSAWAIHGAVQAGDIELVKLFAGMGPYNIKQSLESAIKIGNQEIIDFLKTELRNSTIRCINRMEQNKPEAIKEYWGCDNFLEYLEKEYTHDKKKWGDDFDPILYQFYQDKINKASFNPNKRKLGSL